MTKEEIDFQIDVLKRENDRFFEEIRQNKNEILSLIESDNVFHNADEPPDTSRTVLTPNGTKVLYYEGSWYFLNMYLPSGRRALAKVDKWCEKQDYRWELKND